MNVTLLMLALCVACAGGIFEIARSSALMLLASRDISLTVFGLEDEFSAVDAAFGYSPILSMERKKGARSADAESFSWHTPRGY
jgi:hypothetical protein